MNDPTPDCFAFRTVARWAAAGLVAGSLVACADLSGITPQSSLRDAASVGLGETSGGAVNAQAATPIDARWWLAFGDESLNRLVAQALQDNPSLKLAQVRLEGARAAMDATGAALLPQLGVQLDLTQQRYTANGLVPPPLAGTVSDSGTAQLAASWELDFFGKNRAALDAALGSAKAAEVDLQAARMLLASQVVRGYFQWVRLNAQAGVAKSTLAQRQALLKLVQARFDAGLDTPLELRQSEAGLPEARLQQEALREQIALTRNALAALVGRPVSTLPSEPMALDAIRKLAVAPVIPADLLGHRADVVAARWRVQAASQSVQNARLQFYPNINLAAFAGFSSIGLDQLFRSGSQQWGVSPALRLPIFEAGRLRAGLRGKTAELDAAVESYNAALLGAVHDVADQVASWQAIERQQTEQAATGRAAQDAFDSAAQRYQAGLGNYLAVLNAQSGVLLQQRVAIDLAGRALDTQVALIHALGGGFSATDTPQIP